MYFCNRAIETLAKSLMLPIQFIQAIHMVESSGKYGAIRGDNGAALGPLQIHRAYWADSQIEGKYEDCADYHYSVRVMDAYLNRYAKQAVRNNAFETMARIHKGGPQGANKQSSVAYWHLVKYQLDKYAKAK